MGPVAAVTATVVLAVLMCFQVALAAGAPWGKLAWGGRHRVLPNALRFGSGLSILIYALIALILLSRAGLVQVVGDTTATVLTWVVTGYLALGVLMNLASRSRPERLVMAPVAGVLAGLGLLVALS